MSEEIRKRGEIIKKAYTLYKELTYLELADWDDVMKIARFLVEEDK